MTSITRCPLDHAVISVRTRMDEAAAIYTRMGFTLTERSFHAAGSCNHLMVFERDYLELIGFPPDGQAIRADLQDALIGLDGLVLHAGDVEGIHRALVARGFPVGAPQPLARKLTLPGSAIEQEARFTTLRFPRGALQGGRLYYCRHETPQLVWHAPFQSHANTALGIASFTIAVPDPIAEIARYERILDTRAQIGADGSARIQLGHATLELLTPAALESTLGALACDAADAEGRARDAYMAMVTIKVRDLAVTQRALRRGGFSPARLGEHIVVPASEAMNCSIAFAQ
ncbi:MAG: VOC family protein [Betaproteobacteria bacterium]|nr:VOC family protein [Betaproteobacteria bacterium]